MLTQPLATLYGQQSKKKFPSSLQCAECNVQCADKKALDRHVRSAHKVAYNCDFCGAKLASEKSLARHKKKHSSSEGMGMASGKIDDFLNLSQVIPDVT